MKTLTERVVWLVDQMAGRSVNAAAKRIGVPQTTLARLYRGDTANPRADVVQKIADAFGCSVVWLLRGEGEGPKDFRRSEERDWYAVVESLGLDEASARMLQNPMGIGYFVLGQALDAAGGQKRSISPDKLTEVALDFLSAQYNAWAAYLDSLIKLLGPDAARTLFTPLPKWLVDLDAVFRTNEELFSKGADAKLALLSLLTESNQRS